MSSHHQPGRGDLATATREAPAPGGGRRASRRKERGSSAFRPDIEGLRAIAVLLVLAFHAAPKLLPGGFVGVDVFFVISGFLITSLLVHEINKNGRLSLAGFYARRAKRLLPAACLTLLAAAGLTYVFLPITQRSVFGGDILAAALYFVNWRLADRSVDYLAADVMPSPVQHFWSLAVEEQFYLVWPVLIVLALWIAPKIRVALPRLLAVVISLVAAVSLFYSVVHTANSPEAAFFVTPTRFWELAVGAIVALALPHLDVFLGGTRAVISTLGVLMILGGGYFIDGTFAWPGYWALLPTLGAAAVLAGGVGGPAGAGRLLALKPLVWVGGISYSLYLWHWPLLVAAQAEWGTGTKVGVAAVAVSVLPAWLSHKLVENPIRFSTAFARPFKAAWAVGLPFTAVAVACGVLLAFIGAGSDDKGGPVAGAAMLNGMNSQQQGDLWKTNRYPTVRPDPLKALADIPEAYPKKCQANQDTPNVASCDFGDTSAPTVVVMAGDSKMLQWEPALDAIGKEHGIHIVTVTKSSCAFSDSVTVLNDRAYKSCADWNKNAMAKILELHPAMVLTSQNSARALSDPAGAGEGEIPPMRDGLERHWTTLQKAGIPVTVVLNNVNGVPSPVYECVAKNRSKLSKCAFDSNYETADLQTELAKKLNLGVIDLNPMICPGGKCPAVIGSALVYRDGSHITATYVKTLVPALQDQLKREFERNRLTWK
ncbi:acyltransferase family protein [Kitasatospora sp. CB01950]|uniref:acyltransferase family protein n=1 Tax=Kitasatospora sp. CB01950 TaxID=1703930 RepID=UPI000AD9BEF2|nr:acyltransferase family protein [Kitasatospora sp. CB01950]